jgi:hypothetical protein
LSAPGSASRSFANANQNNNRRGAHIATNKPLGVALVRKTRSQLATKTIEKIFTKRNKEGGQFMAQKKTRKFKGV